MGGSQRYIVIMKWTGDAVDRKFMALAQHVAEWSTDTSTKIGAVIAGSFDNVIATGANRLVDGIVQHDKRKERPAKYLYTVHAEVRAICNAAMAGVSTKGATMYVSGLPPCHNCAQAIVTAGIDRVVVASMDVPDRWQESISAGKMILQETITLNIC